MSRIGAILVVFAFLMGGMGGYTFAYLRIFKSAKEAAPPLEKSVDVDSEPISPTPTVESEDLADKPLSQVVYETTEQTVLPLDSASEPVLEVIAQAADATMEKLNRPDSPLLLLRRINEASRFFEDELRERLDAHPEMSCDFPRTREGKLQRSGYPDLVLRHRPSGRTYYLDPKLYEKSSEDSTLRTFYYTPRSSTSKITRDAHHVLIGFAHDGADGAWNFTGWKLVDLATVPLTLKSEHNASNRDLYEVGNVIRKSD